MRERGNIWPVILVTTGAVFVLVIVPLMIERSRSSRMATVDAQVSIGDANTTAPASPEVSKYRWPDSEVPRTAERLRDVTGVAIAATAYIVQGSIQGRPPRDTREIIIGVAQRNLIPSNWLTKNPGVLQTQHATIHLRYSPRNLNVELLSVPEERTDGPAILIRVPDSENTGVGARYFESVQLDGITYPAPFAPIANIIASGWQPRLFKQTQLPDADRAQIELWTKAAISK